MQLHAFRGNGIRVSKRFFWFLVLTHRYLLAYCGLKCLQLDSNGTGVEIGVCKIQSPTVFRSRPHYNEARANPHTN
jgi:hypothetical protein